MISADIGSFAPIRRLGRAAAAGVVVLGLAGCATGPDGQTTTIADDVSVLYMSTDGLSPVEVRSLERVQRFATMRVQGSTVGAIGGVITGALAGFFACDDAALACAVGGAAAGGAAGGALGYLAGAYYAKLNAASEDRRNDLNFQLASARESVSETRAAVRDTKEIVSSERKKIRRLNRDYKAGKVTQEQYKGRIARLGDKVQIINEQLRSAQNDVNTMNGVIESAQKQGRGTGKLAGQRRQMERQVSALRKERDALVTAVATIPDEVDPPDVGEKA